MRTVNAVLIGAGSRGMLTYGDFAARFPQRMKFVAVADPNPGRLAMFAEAHSIPKERRFGDWRELIDAPLMGEVLVNATGDRMHVDITEAAVAKGYHVLQEKPIASTVEECTRLLAISRSTDRLIAVCHCLRFTSFYKMAKEMMDSGKIGDAISMDYQENVTFDHMAHSFVRGNYASEADSTPMLLAKACHDLDMLVWFAAGRKAKRVASFGSLSVFKPENAPAGAPKRCTDGCPVEHKCPYSAIKTYIKELGPNIGYGGGQWQVSPSLDPEKRWKALETGPFGRCVYHCENDVVDHQVVNVEFEGGLTVAFTMQGFGAAWPSNISELHGPMTGGVGRTFTVFGTKGVLHAPVYGHLELSDFLIKHTEKIHTGEPEGSHGGGDFGLIHAFLDSIQGARDAMGGMVSLEEAVSSHVLGFAAEKARKDGIVVDVAEFSAEKGVE